MLPEIANAALFLLTIAAFLFLAAVMVYVSVGILKDVAGDLAQRKAAASALLDVPKLRAELEAERAAHLALRRGLRRMIDTGFDFGGPGSGCGL